MLIFPRWKVGVYFFSTLFTPLPKFWQSSSKLILYCPNTWIFGDHSVWKGKGGTPVRTKSERSIKPLPWYIKDQIEGYCLQSIRLIRCPNSVSMLQLTSDRSFVSVAAPEGVAYLWCPAITKSFQMLAGHNIKLIWIFTTSFLGLYITCICFKISRFDAMFWGVFL